MRRVVSRVVAAVLAGLAVVLVPSVASAKSYRAPITPYPDLPTQQAKALAGSGRSGVSVSSARLATAAKNGSNVAEVGKAVTGTSKLMRGVGVGAVLVEGLQIGFGAGAAGLQIYADTTGNTVIPESVCGTGWGDVTSVLYPELSPDCVVTYVEGQINADVNAVPEGWTGSPVFLWGPGTYGSYEWSAASISVSAVSGPAFGSSGHAQWVALGSYTGTNPTGQGYTVGSNYVDVAVQTLKKSTGAWGQVKNGTMAWASKTSYVYSSNYLSPVGWATSAGVDVVVNSTSESGYRLKFVKRTDSGGVSSYGDPVYWYPPGAPDRPAGQSGDPVRESGCTLTWPDGSTTKVAGEKYLESVGFPIYSAGAACNAAAKAATAAGQVGLPVKVDVTSKNTETDEITTISTATPPSYTDEEKQALNDKTGSGLVLMRGGKSCLTWDVDCSDWWTETDGATATDTDYRCLYGGVEVALSQCAVYRKTFIDPDEDGTTGTKPGTVTITDPVTNLDEDWASDGKNQNSVDPGTGPGTSENPGGECLASWSEVANPIEWVLTPVKCALVWAFVPRTSVVQSSVTGAVDAWSQTMPGQIAALGVQAFTVTGVEGCEGLRVQIPLNQFRDEWPDVDWQVLNACDEPGKTVAWWARTIGAALLIFNTGLGIVRKASATVNAPGIDSAGES